MIKDDMEKNKYQCHEVQYAWSGFIFCGVAMIIIIIVCFVEWLIRILF